MPDPAHAESGGGEHIMHAHPARGAPAGNAVTDPVCGMQVDPHTAHRHEHRGRAYYFCSTGCRAKFAADPARYLSETAGAKQPVEGAIYTCPMHPEIRK